MDNRTLAAVIISVAVLIGYQYFFVKPAPPQQPVQTKQAPAEVKETKAAVEAKKPAAPAKAAVPEITGTEKEIVVENSLYKAVFTSRGATLKQIEIKGHKDSSGKPIVLKADSAYPPFVITTADGRQMLVNYQIEGGNVTLNASAKEGSVVFKYSTGSYFINRTYTFREGTYAFDLKDEVQGISGYSVSLGRDFGIFEKSDSDHTGPVVLKDADRLEFNIKDLQQPKIFKEGLKWIAQEDKYFFSAIVPKNKIEEARVEVKDSVPMAALRMNSGTNSYLLYAGPKERDTLKDLGVGLEHIVDFGFFSILALPLFWLLKQLYMLVHNYGIAIIILTILTRIPFIPLINKSQKSMKKLQDVQPLMAEIREKYKKDPQRMQKELMELYKRHKVNPMGGCLPMLIQIPVFFALFKVLGISIELRHAPFMLWVNDLSVKDPYFVLPILMGITMFIQQKMTPSTMDPTQQKMMLFMPIVFTFLFFTFPSGLVLYWLVSNILSIIQQYFVNKKLEAQKA
ncbi:MAG: membrane protein insertase YidC [Nitrospiraceae bacterium]|nr:membrane protein insertase YidC [Nitrospiraceae bacterium]